MSLLTGVRVRQAREGQRHHRSRAVCFLLTEHLYLYPQCLFPSRSADALVLFCYTTPVFSLSRTRTHTRAHKSVCLFPHKEPHRTARPNAHPRAVSQTHTYQLVCHVFILAPTPTTSRPQGERTLLSYPLSLLATRAPQAYLGPRLFHTSFHAHALTQSACTPAPPPCRYAQPRNIVVRREINMENHSKYWIDGKAARRKDVCSQ